MKLEFFYILILIIRFCGAAEPPEQEIESHLSKLEKKLEDANFVIHRLDKIQSNLIKLKSGSIDMGEMKQDLLFVEDKLKSVLSDLENEKTISPNSITNNGKVDNERFAEYMQNRAFKMVEQEIYPLPNKSWYGIKRNILGVEQSRQAIATFKKDYDKKKDDIKNSVEGWRQIKEGNILALEGEISGLQKQLDFLKTRQNQLKERKKNRYEQAKLYKESLAKFVKESELIFEKCKKADAQRKENEIVGKRIETKEKDEVESNKEHSIKMEQMKKIKNNLIKRNEYVENL
jgi:hypothetical protein